MQRGAVIYRFGAFEFHPATGQLFHRQERVPLTARLSALLLELLSRAPDIVTRRDLMKAVWRGHASDSSIEVAVSQVRKALAVGNGAGYIETAANEGYRCGVRVERVEAQGPGMVETLNLESLREFVQARREMATLKRDAIQRMRQVARQTIQQEPGYAPAYVALSQACALSFDASRFDAVCDLEALNQAVEYGRASTIRDPASGDAWATFSFGLSLQSEKEAAMVAAQKALALEPASWRHAIRLSHASRGEERIQAAHLALALRPLLTFAHLLIATVLIARGAYEAALAELDAGCAAQDKQVRTADDYRASGLHHLRGLVLAALGREDEAMRAFACELAIPDRGQLYYRETAAKTWYARGALHLRRREFTDASTRDRSS